MITPTAESYNSTVAHPATAAVPHWSDRLISELNASDLRAAQIIAGLTSEQLNWRPSAAAWSVGQCLEHLAVTNELYLPPIAKALDGKPASPVAAITPGWFGRWFIASFAEPSSKTKRARAPKQIQPASRVDVSILDRFLVSNDAVRELIQRARDYNVNRIRFAHPFVPGIRFTVGTGLEIASGHERRHLLQAERVKQYSGFPGTIR
jgi:hypothetical protein